MKTGITEQAKLQNPHNLVPHLFPFFPKVLNISWVQGQQFNRSALRVCPCLLAPRAILSSSACSYRETSSAVCLREESAKGGGPGHIRGAEWEKAPFPPSHTAPREFAPLEMCWERNGKGYLSSFPRLWSQWASSILSWNQVRAVLESFGLETLSLLKITEDPKEPCCMQFLNIDIYHTRNWKYI